MNFKHIIQSLSINNTRSLLVVLFLFILCSCENKIETIKAIPESNKSPILSCKDIDILYSDSAVVRMVVKSKQIDRYRKQAFEYYSEFPKGLIVDFYNTPETKESTIKADFAKYFEDKKLWHAERNVVATNVKTGEKLESDELFWDESKKIIYSHRFTKITNKDGVFTGKGGFTAKQNFTAWKLFGASGQQSTH